jgi:hypothetical protein
MSIDPHTSLVLYWTARVFPEPALILLSLGPTAEYRCALFESAMLLETAVAVPVRDLRGILKHVTGHVDVRLCAPMSRVGPQLPRTRTARGP